MKNNMKNNNSYRQEGWRKKYSFHRDGQLLTTILTLGQLPVLIAEGTKAGVFNDAYKRLIVTAGSNNGRIIRVDLVFADEFHVGDSIQMPKINEGVEIANVFTAPGGIVVASFRRIGQIYRPLSDYEGNLVLNAGSAMQTPDGQLAKDTRFLGDGDTMLARIGKRPVTFSTMLSMIGYHVPTCTFIGRTPDGAVISIRASALVENPTLIGQPDRWQPVHIDAALTLERIAPFNEYKGIFSAPARGTFKGNIGNGQIAFNPANNAITLTAPLDAVKPYVVTSRNNALMTYNQETLALIPGGQIAEQRGYASGRQTRALGVAATKPA